MSRSGRRQAASRCRWSATGLLVVLVGALLAACSNPRLPVTKPIRTPEVPTTGLRTLWETDLADAGIRLRRDWREPLVAIAADAIVVTGTDGTTVGFDRATGVVRWKKALLPVPWDEVEDQAERGERAEPDPTTGYDSVRSSGTGLVFVRSFNWTVAVDPASGDVPWAEVGYQPTFSPTSPLLFLGGASQLHRINPRTRRDVWASEPSHFLAGMTNEVVIGIDRGDDGPNLGEQQLTARSVQAGMELWTAPAPDAPADLVVGSTPGRAVVLDEDGRLTAFDAATGARAWESSVLATTATGRPTDAEPRLLGIDDRAVYAGVYDDGGAAVVAVSTADGTRTWRRDLPWERKPFGSAVDGRVLATTPEYLVVLAPDGTPVASRGDLAGLATMAGRTVCAVVRSGDRPRLTCLELA